jgi:hypothetical protein
MFAQGMGASYLGVAETVIQVAPLLHHGRQKPVTSFECLFTRQLWGGRLRARLPPSVTRLTAF